MASEVQQLVDDNPTARGLVLIVTNSYEDNTSDDLRDKPLPGCHVDGKEMEETFKNSLKFACLWKKNCHADEIKGLVEQVAKCKFSGSYKFFAFAFSGHGNKNCVLGNNGGGVDIERSIVYPLEPGVSATASKITKMFFIDACRGNFKMSSADAKGGDSPKPKRGGYLIAYATFKEYSAYMSSSASGSKWMTPLAKELRLHQNEPVRVILGRVFEAITADPNGYQVPYINICCGNIFLYGDGADPTPTLDSISPRESSPKDSTGGAGPTPPIPPGGSAGAPLPIHNPPSQTFAGPVSGSFILGSGTIQGSTIAVGGKSVAGGGHSTNIGGSQIVYNTTNYFTSPGQPSVGGAGSTPPPNPPGGSSIGSADHPSGLAPQRIEGSVADQPPTRNLLLCIKAVSTGKDINITKIVSSHDAVTVKRFAQFLLEDDMTVDVIFNQGKTPDQLADAVLGTWLDSNENISWSHLIESMRRGGMKQAYIAKIKMYVL